MRSQNCIRLLTIISFVWHLCYKIEVAADIFVNASATALSSSVGQGFAFPSTLIHPSSQPFSADMNGDTYPDLVLPYYFGNIVYIVFGTPTGIPQVDVQTMTLTQGITISGPSGINFGYTSAYVGDVNEDYVDDILIGNGGTTGTTAYVIFGRNGTALTNVNVASMTTDQGITLTGPATFGGVVASAGDVNGDGVNDMLASATGATNPSGVASGVAYVIFGKTGLSSMNVASLTTDEGFKVYGSVASQTFGSALSAAGDVNKDGVADFMVGAAAATAGGVSSAGFVGVFYGRKTGIADIDASAISGRGYLINGYTAQGALGQKSTIASAGDVNGDSIGDMIIGQPAYSVSGTDSQGRAYIIYGQEGTSTSSFAINTISGGQGGFTITGDAAGSAAGYGVASGDINNDTLTDLVVSAYGASIPSAVGTGASAGRVYVFFGHGGTFSNIDLSQSETNYPLTVEYYGLAGKNFGYSVSTGDINGDGVDDVLGTSQSNTNTILLYGTTCSASAQCSSSLHPVCYASLGCKCGETGKYLQSNQCVDQCSGGYYMGDTQCQSCPSTCATCTSASTCQTCSGSNLLQGTSCVATCGSGFYKSGTSCLGCPNTCSTCTGATTCQTCSGANLLQETSCVTSCDPGYYKSGTQCLACPNTCSTCTGATTCQTCSGANLLQDTSCVASCDPGYYQSGTQCLTCPNTCSTCTGATTCQTCSGANLLEGTSCVATCDSGFYKSGTNCLACPNTCATCTGATTCQTCSGANLLQDTSCVASCDPGYTQSGTNCLAPVVCPSTCATCSDANTCLTCNGANLLQGTSCVASCSQGYTQSGTNCIADSNTGGTNSGGTSSNPETTTADSSSNHAGLIVGVVLGSVALITGAITALYYRSKIIAKFRRGGRAAKYASSTPNKPTAQITEGVRLNQAKGGEQTPLNPQNPSGPASPNSESGRFLPQAKQTHQVLKVEVDP